MRKVPFLIGTNGELILGNRDWMIAGAGAAGPALEGARMMLLDHSRLIEAKELAENIYCVQFASIPDFLIRMQAAKFIPHTDMRRFPSVQSQSIPDPKASIDAGQKPR